MLGNDLKWKRENTDYCVCPYALVCSLRQAVNPISVGCEEDWRMGRAPESCIELQSHSRKHEAWPLVTGGRMNSQGAGTGAAPWAGWLRSAFVVGLP